jgi:hypothetical protein
MLRRIKMGKFRKKPVEVEAIQLRWDTWDEICNFVPKEYFGGGVYIEDGEILDDGYISDTIGLKIKTLEGEMLATQNDYIIKGVKGEFYPCTPDIFEATYDEIE